MPPHKLLCLENPLLDIQALAPASLLQKYGLRANDAILASEQHLPLYADLASLHASHLAGGAAQNSARGAQYLLPPRTVVFLGAVGKDDGARLLDEACGRAGLATAYLRLDGVPTGRCGVLITGESRENRSMVTDLAAANHYRLEHLRSPEVWELAAGASVYFVGGFHLTVCPAAAEALGKEAVEKDKVFAMGISAPFIPVAFHEALNKLLAYADYVISNESEFGAWAEVNGLAHKKEDLAAVAGAVAALPKHNGKRERVVVVTHGTEATVVATGRPGGEARVETYPVHAVDAKEIKDTTGAGDAFAGGFLAGLCEGKEVPTCVDMGHWLARLSLMESGAAYVLIPFTSFSSLVCLFRGPVLSHLLSRRSQTQPTLIPTFTDTPKPYTNTPPRCSGQVLHSTTTKRGAAAAAQRSGGAWKCSMSSKDRGQRDGTQRSEHDKLRDSSLLRSFFALFNNHEQRWSWWRVD